MMGVSPPVTRTIAASKHGGRGDDVIPTALPVCDANCAECFDRLACRRDPRGLPRRWPCSHHVFFDPRWPAVMGGFLVTLGAACGGALAEDIDETDLPNDFHTAAGSLSEGEGAV